jgi:hypothetical protein
VGAIYGLYRRLAPQARFTRLVLDNDLVAGGTPSYAPLFLNPSEPPTNASEGAVYFDDDLHALMQSNGSGWEQTGSTPSTLAVADADGLTVNGVIVPAIQYMNFQLKPFATVTEYDLAVIKRALQVVSIDVVPSTLQGGALTATIVKAASTDTPVKTTTPLHTADSINLNTGAYTNQSVTLTATAADLVFAAGNRLAIDFSAAYTAGHAALTIGFKYV